MIVNFTKEGPRYVAKGFTTATKFVMQVERESNGYFTVYGSVGGLPPVSIFVEPMGGRKDLIFEVDVPESVELTFISDSLVINAAYEETL